MRRHSTENGQALVLIALVSVVLCGLAALALDIGVATSDRRALQQYSDAAALAGAVAFGDSGPQPDTANLVAMEYVAKNLSVSLPSGCSATGGSGGTPSCPAGTYTIGKYTITLTDTGTSTMDLSIQNKQPAFMAAIIGFTGVTDGASARAVKPVPRSASIGYALVGLRGDVQVNGGGTGSPSGDVSGAVYAYGNFGANNGPHAVSLPSNVSDGNGNACSPTAANHVDVGGSSDSLNYKIGGSSGANLNPNTPAPSLLTGGAPSATGPTYAPGSSSAVSGGSWQPGTYNGWYPSASSSQVSHPPSTMAPGVYVIKNVTSGISVDGLTNKTAGAQGAYDTSGAVAVVVDSSDNGSTLDFSGSTLNGLDDSTGGTGSTPDPEGTHNYVVYGAGFTGGTDFGGAALTGIVYLPNSDASSHGNASWTLSGSVWVNTFSLKGGGNGTQVFQYVCNLSVVVPRGGAGGLVR